MSYPGVIERPLDADEFSIYFDNSNPIPLYALATFLQKIDKAAQLARGMAGGYLQLSDFALGSSELRFKVVGPGRIAKQDEARQERIAVAAEKSAKWAKTSAGADVVTAVAAVVAIAITSGSANPSAYRITNQYNVDAVYIRAPDAAPHIISHKEIEYEWQHRRTDDKTTKAALIEAEHDFLSIAMNRHEIVNLAGKVRRDKKGDYVFVTMRGNRLPVNFPKARDYQNKALAIQVVVQDSPHGLALDVIDIIAELSDL